MTPSRRRRLRRRTRRALEPVRQTRPPHQDVVDQNGVARVRWRQGPLHVEIASSRSGPITFMVRCNAMWSDPPERLPLQTRQRRPSATPPLLVRKRRPPALKRLWLI